MAETLDAVCSTADTRTALDTAKHELKALEDLFSSRREKSKFDRDSAEGEQGSAYFFQSPTTTAYRVAIPSVTKIDGSTTSDPEEMAA
ncbi:hypothetical protein P3T76_012068 [Phytophthora citrophthora]|uniref:Uncharacterized protein n=1 Tax=Phytophthora citrophthora TaxID=4793 RepID=A0AAD9LEC9_9STRA|nr:hypothetical protein P3T76_012068 [Phytophthora citrophthora]